MNLPYDYSRCVPKDCPIKESCARFKSPWHPEGWQSVADFSPAIVAGKCPEYLSMLDYT